MTRTRAFCVCVVLAGCSATVVRVDSEHSRCEASRGLMLDVGFGDAAVESPYVVELSLDISQQCALLSDATVRCRGSNTHGELGDGTNEPTLGAVRQPVGVGDVVQVVVGFESVCARHSMGTVSCWGSNRYHQLGVGHVGDEECRSAPEDPCRTRAVLLAGLTDVIHLTAGRFAYCAVRRDGSVWCWGSANFPSPQVGYSVETPTEMPGVRDVVWIRAVDSGWLMRFRDGHFEFVPPYQSIQVPVGAVVPDGIRGRHVCYSLPDTTMRCLGYNPYGQIGTGTSSYPERVDSPWDPGLCGVRSIATDDDHTCVILADRLVRCWGNAEHGGPGVPGSARCVGMQGPTSCVPRPTLVPGVDQVERIFVGGGATCAIRSDRTVWCWGYAVGASTHVPIRRDWR
jgi:alpha-tubulin suppressor-like RCC1 family protein